MASFRKRNNKWQVQVRSRKSVSKSRSFLRKEDAKRWALEQEIKLLDSQHLMSKYIKLSVKDLMVRYLELVTPTKRGHGPEIRRLNRLISEKGLMAISLRKVRPHDFAQFRDQRIKQGARTCHYDLVLLRHAWNVARIEWGWNIGPNPVSLIRFPRLNPPRERRLRTGEFELLHRESQKSKAWYLWPIINLAIETAMRRGEILSLTWVNVDFQRSQVFLPMTKNGRSRYVPLTDAATSILQNIAQDVDKVFSITDNAFRQTWDRLRVRAGLNDLTFHDLRHEAISRMFEKNMPIPQVMAVTGHRTVAQLFRYVQIA